MHICSVLISHRERDRSACIYVRGHVGIEPVSFCSGSLLHFGGHSTTTTFWGTLDHYSTLGDIRPLLPLGDTRPLLHCGGHSTTSPLWGTLGHYSTVGDSASTPLWRTLDVYSTVGDTRLLLDYGVHSASIPLWETPGHY